MNKQDLIAKVAQAVSLTKKQAAEVLDVTFETIEEAVAGGEKVQIIGFGTFEAKTRAAREGLNPRTKEPIKIAQSTVPGFKAGKRFKEKVNK